MNNWDGFQLSGREDNIVRSLLEVGIDSMKPSLPSYLKFVAHCGNCHMLTQGYLGPVADETDLQGTQPKLAVHA